MGVDASSSRVFRVVLHGGSSLRLMEKAGDKPSIWRLPFASGPVRLVAVRDVVTAENELPRHLGFQYVVDIESTGIDEAAEEAKPWAETTAFMLAATSRAPVERLVVQLAYEITPGIDEREFRQWVWNPPIPTSKPVANAGSFGELRERIDALTTDRPSERFLWRSTISVSWFRQALEETDPIFRFHKLWIAAEALNPLLDEHYEIQPDGRKGFQGLRSLATEVGLGSEWVSKTLGIRRDLFHGRRITADDLRRRSESVLADLEGLCVAGWQLLLQLEQPVPEESVVPHPLYVRVHAVLHHKDESVWDVDSHPFLEARFNPEKVAAGDPRDVTFKLSTTYTGRNVDGCRITGQGMWGPTGYRPLRLEEGDEVQVDAQASATETLEEE